MTPPMYRKPNPEEISDHITVIKKESITIFNDFFHPLYDSQSMYAHARKRVSNKRKMKVAVRKKEVFFEK